MMHFTKIKKKVSAKLRRDVVAVPVRKECPECRLIKLRTAVTLQSLEVVRRTGLFLSGEIQYISICLFKFRNANPDPADANKKQVVSKLFCLWYYIL